MLKKNSIKLSVTGLVLSVLGAVAQPVMAADPNWYVGAGVGRAEVGIGASEVRQLLGSDVTNISSSIDNDDTAYKLTVGYQYTKNISVEASYINFGDIDIRANGQDGAETRFGTVDADTYGITLAVVGKWEIGNDFSLLGKIGVFHWQSDIDIGLTQAGVGLDINNIDDDGNDFFYGVGAQYDFGEFAIRVEYEIYNDVVEDDYDVYTVNLLYRF